MKKKQWQLLRGHVFTSKQNTDGNNSGKPHINWSKDHGVINRTGKLGGRKEELVEEKEELIEEKPSVKSAKEKDAELEEDKLIYKSCRHSKRPY